MRDASSPLLRQRLEVHDRKQVELKLECQPTGAHAQTRYRVELFLFVPTSLHIDGETYPRPSVYADVHNYVRLKTPVLPLPEVLAADCSPLRQLERWGEGALVLEEGQVVARAKLLACVMRGALRRFAHRLSEDCEDLPADAGCPAAVQEAVREGQAGVEAVLARYRRWLGASAGRPLGERTRGALRLVDESLSLALEQFFRMAVADMGALRRTGEWARLGRELMAGVLREEAYRRAQGMSSVLNPTGDNEEYLHRMGMLKKFCSHALFLEVRRTQARQGLDELLFALAAGLAMALATAIGAWAQLRYEALSLQFFVILVTAYMMKDRAKEALRRAFAAVATRHLFDRGSEVHTPSGREALAAVREKVDYLGPRQVPPEVAELRRADELVRAAAGALSETVLRYQRDVVLEVPGLPHLAEGPAGLTDILRLNVGRLLRDMDEPELALEYVDLEDLSVGRVRGAKSYRVDLACRFTCEEGRRREVTLTLARLVLDRNGIKRMERPLEWRPSVHPSPAAGGREGTWAESGGALPRRAPGGSVVG